LFWVKYALRSKATNIEFKNIRFNDSVVKDVDSLIYIEGVGSTKLTDLKMEQIVVNS